MVTLKNSKMKSINKLILLFLSATAFLVSCKKDNDFIRREETRVTVDCLSQTVQQNIQAKGDWTIDTQGCDWVSVSPDSGTGNGEDYQMFSISVTYNGGGSREATIYVCQGSTRCPVTIHQNRCKFGFTGVEMVDSLFQTKESTAGINVKYAYAAGNEKTTLKATLSGAASAGLSVQEIETSDFKAGSGALYLPITGIPTTKGKFDIEVFADGKSIGTCQGEVTEYIPPRPVFKAAGLPAKWNFFEFGLTGTAPLATEMGQYWKLADPDPRVYPTSGNGEATLRAVMANGPVIVQLSGADEAYTYNPAMQVNGLLCNDYWLVTIPVYHFDEDTQISVEAAVSTAAKGVGYYILEYSADGSKWIEAPGATTITHEGIASFKAHYWQNSRSVSNYPTGTRKHLDKTDPDETYHKYVFKTTGVTIEEGNFYLRLRALKYRWDFSADAVAAWTDLKCFEVDFVE